MGKVGVWLHQSKDEKINKIKKININGDMAQVIGERCGIETYHCFGNLGMTFLYYILTKVSVIMSLREFI